MTGYALGGSRRIMGPVYNNSCFTDDRHITPLVHNLCLLLKWYSWSAGDGRRTENGLQSERQDCRHCLNFGESQLGGDSIVPLNYLPLYIGQAKPYSNTCRTPHLGQKLMQPKILTVVCAYHYFRYIPSGDRQW